MTQWFQEFLSLSSTVLLVHTRHEVEKLVRVAGEECNSGPFFSLSIYGAGPSTHDLDFIPIPSALLHFCRLYLILFLQPGIHLCGIMLDQDTFGNFSTKHQLWDNCLFSNVYGEHRREHFHSYVLQQRPEAVFPKKFPKSLVLVYGQETRRRIICSLSSSGPGRRDSAS